jgi:prevent-host-death family protein
MRTHAKFDPTTIRLEFEGESTSLLNHHDHIDQDEVVPMISETNAVAFRQNLGEMINRVQYRRDSIVISKDGKPVAALVDARLFARIRQMHERFDALTGRIAAAYAAVPMDEGLTEIDRVVTATKAGKPAKTARKKKG